MWSGLRECSVKVKLEEHELKVPKFIDNSVSNCKEPIIVPSSSSSSSSSSEDKSPENENQADESSPNTSQALVLYNPVANGSVAIEAVPERVGYPTLSYSVNSPSDRSSRILPSVGAFTVQCAKCFKWRLIPTKEKYEEIREFILEQPFVCETAREWQPYVSCDDPPDITQDGSRLWAIDKPNIAQPPPGWQRLLRIRGEGSTKFADVYYVAPSGKRLRSMVEIQKYLLQHPEYMTEGVNPARFSFQIPKPLQQNYVRKRPARLAASCDVSRPYGLDQVNPVRWAGADDFTALQLGRPGQLPECFEAPILNPTHQLSNKRTRKDSDW